jgi:hypothetical protein
MTTVNDFQIRQMCCALLESDVDEYKDCANVEEFLERLTITGEISLPAFSRLYVIPQRVAIFAAIAKPNSAWLIQILQDRPDDTALVVDAIDKGRNAMYIARLISNKDQVNLWLSYMSPGRMHFTIRPVDAEQHVLVAALSCFIRRPQFA